MGGRGASSGMSVKGKKYGTEYTTLLQVDNIKYVKYNDSNSVKAPMETMTKNRIYATIDSNNDVRYITFYDENGKRFKQIDVKGRPHIINGEPKLPHTHYGYEHDEYGTYELSAGETSLVEFVLSNWYNKLT